MLKFPVQKGEQIWVYTQRKWYKRFVSKDHLESTSSIEAFINGYTSGTVTQFFSKDCFRTVDAQVGDVFTTADDSNQLKVISVFNGTVIRLVNPTTRSTWGYGPNLAGNFTFEDIKPVFIQGYNLSVLAKEPKSAAEYPLTPNEAYPGASSHSLEGLKSVSTIDPWEFEKRMAAERMEVEYEERRKKQEFEERQQQKIVNFAENYGSMPSWLKEQEQKMAESRLGYESFKYYRPQMGLQVQGPSSYYPAHAFDHQQIEKQLKRQEEDYDIPQPQKVKPVDLGDLWEL